LRGSAKSSTHEVKAWIMTEEEIRTEKEKSRAFVETFTMEPTVVGLLSGLSFAVKDLIDVQGFKTGCGNPTWRDTHPIAAVNAVCVEQLLLAGARCLGKTVTDELAFGLNGENFFFGTPLNPRAPDRVPGGSSSGSASAVACGLVDFALGTDTGGSIRVPASNCGIFGMRPTPGIISVAGVNPLAPSFDTVGVLARSWDVLAAVASVMLNCHVPRSAHVGTVHVLQDAFAGSDPEVADALMNPFEGIKNLFPGRTREISLRDIGEEASQNGMRGWFDTYCGVQWAEIWSCLGPWVEECSPEFGPRTKVNFQLARDLDRKIAVRALMQREVCYRLVKDLLGPEDLLCMPTTPTLAPIKGTLGLDRSKDAYSSRTLAFNAIAGIGRLPQVTLPVAEVGGVPIGLSLLAGQGRDGFLLSVAQRVVGGF
jgi:amidase